VLRFIDLGCAAAFVCGCLVVGWRVLERASETTPWLALAAVPLLVTAVWFGWGLWRNPDHGLRLRWPLTERRWRPPSERRRRNRT